MLWNTSDTSQTVAVILGFPWALWWSKASWLSQYSRASMSLQRQLSRCVTCRCFSLESTECKRWWQLCSGLIISCHCAQICLGWCAKCQFNPKVTWCSLFLMDWTAWAVGVYKYLMNIFLKKKPHQVYLHWATYSGLSNPFMSMSETK